jgi:carbamoyl-phosphate synthase large subunit
MEALRLSGRPCRIVAADSDPAAAGLYRADVGVILPSGGDPGYVDEVVAVCRRHGVQAVLAGSDREVMALAPATTRIREASGAVALVSPPTVTSTCCDKWETALFFVENGLRHPRTFLPPGAGEGAFDGQLAFPVLIKPRFGSGAREVFVAYDADELRVLLRRVDRPIVQEYLAGEEEYTAGLVRTPAGEIFGPIVMRRELKAGSTYRAWVRAHPDVREEVLRVAGALQPVGPCNFQLRMTATGPMTFEINPRFSSSTSIKARYGLNEPEIAVRALLLGESVPPASLSEGVAIRYWNEVYVTHEMHDAIKEHRALVGPSSEVLPYF